MIKGYNKFTSAILLACFLSIPTMVFADKSSKDKEEILDNITTAVDVLSCFKQSTILSPVIQTLCTINGFSCTCTYVWHWIEDECGYELEDTACSGGYFPSPTEEIEAPL